MSIEHLVTMANDIAAYFASEPDRKAAVAGVRDHIRKFWDPSMRQKIIAQLREHDGDGMSDLARAAIEELAQSTGARA